MGLRSRLTKVFAGGLPPEIEAAQDAQGMGPNTAFTPGHPVQPFNGYSTYPRGWDFQTGYNVNARPRSQEPVAYSTLRSLIRAYDVAQICIWHRIDSVRSLGWNIVATPGVENADDAITEATRLMRYPDPTEPRTSFDAWIAPFLFDTLAYDAGCLYRIRSRGGDVAGLSSIDGTTIAPLIDDWGNTPTPPAEAFVQYANGVPFNWLTTDDLIYCPFRPKNDSPYGVPPLETVLLNANTDMRFQAYFLQKFTDGNVPAAFMHAPESWTPQNIKDMQAAWDAYMLGDQSKLHQIQWVPAGTVTWVNDQDFKEEFSLFLMRKTMAAYHVTPSDMGFTEDVNRATSDTQADVQFRIGDMPLIQHTQSILTSYLQLDRGLPVEFQFDTGREKEDRYQTAQADQIYWSIGAIGTSEIREKVFGLGEPDGVPVPRTVMTQRDGPIPLISVFANAGLIDPETGSPVPGQPLPRTAFTQVPGVVPDPPLPVTPLAVEEFGPSAIPAPAPGTPGVVPVPTSAEAAGQHMLGVQKELAAFTRFAKARKRDGKWRDFDFTHLDPITAHRYNDDQRALLRKDAGQLVAAGLCVQAADTGRVLMLQRAYDPTDPASGTWEFPGGHIETGEEPLAAAWREWQEETGCLLTADAGVLTGSWSSSNGIYQGHVLTVPAEAVIDVAVRGAVSNPDDPDGDIVEAIAWFDPSHLSGNPALRAELAADLDVVSAAISPPSVVKAGDAGPKVSWRDKTANTPHAQYDLALTDHYAPLVQAALEALWTPEQLRAAVAKAAVK